MFDPPPPGVIEWCCFIFQSYSASLPKAEAAGLKSSNQRWSRGHKARSQGHKKIRGQGQPFRGQTLSRPRTGMLEAKAKGQGHRRKYSQKKVFKIFFQAISKRGKQKRYSKFSARFLAFSYIILKMNKSNAHHTKWGSSDIKPREEKLLEYCVSADLNLCNVGNKPTFRIKTREEVLDLTSVNWYAWDRVVGWHVSNVLSFSDQIYIILRSNVY